MIDSNGEVNSIISVSASRFGISTQQTDIGAQKIDDSALTRYDMTIARFSVQNKLDKIRFFKGIFLLADTSMKAVLKMPFLTFSNTDIQFDTESLT